MISKSKKAKKNKRKKKSAGKKLDISIEQNALEWLEIVVSAKPVDLLLELYPIAAPQLNNKRFFKSSNVLINIYN